MGALQKNYEWLTAYAAAGPTTVIEALKLYGVHEGIGDADNPEILGWAKELGITDYVHDAEPWCGLFMAYVALKAGDQAPAKPLWALSWAAFGTPVSAPYFGDTVVFRRFDPYTKKLIGGHVGIYIGEDDSCYHVLGGNESDSVTITRIPKERLFAARRPPNLNPLPANVKKIMLPPSGTLSTNEA
jgi:uncharacterized protein (TIGR02594 family)